jgi:hypothetical protein
MAASFLFRFSSPLTVTLRRLTPATYSSWVPSSKRMFLRSALLQKPFSGSETSRHSEGAAQTCQNDEAHPKCQCRREDKFVNMGYDQGQSRFPFLDATLTAIMGIGIGEPQLWTGCLCCFHSLPRYMVGCPSRVRSCPSCDVGPIFTKIRWVNEPKRLVKPPRLPPSIRIHSCETDPPSSHRCLTVRVGCRFLSLSEIRLILGTHPDLS